MGNFVGLRCKVKVKPEYCSMIERLMNEKLDWYSFNNEIPFLERWSETKRSFLIPWGAVQIAEWDEDDPEWKDSFKNGVWKFQCSVEEKVKFLIDLFLSDVLSVIVEDVYRVEKYHSGTRLYINYFLLDGKLLESKE